MERDIILFHLLDKYEKSKHLLEPGVSNRRVMLRMDKKELPEYQYQEAETRDAFNRAAEELERDGLIGVEWVKGRPVLSAVILNLAQVDRCYQTTGRVHPRQQAQLVAGMIQAALIQTETPWIAAWRDEVCAKAGSAYSVPNFCKKDTVFLAELLSALAQYDALRGQPVTMRAFSSRCYHDSKYFERSIRDSFLTIARSHHRELAEACERGDMGVRDQLACLGIYARPELYELSGRCVLTTEMGSIHVDVVWPFGIALPSTAVDSIRSMDLSGIRRVIFIENKTNYDEFLLSELDTDTLAVYHGGFLSPQKRKLFAKLADAVPRQAQVFFWADIDLGGFQMFSRLQTLFPELLPLRMSGADVAAHWGNGLSRSEEYLEQLKQALEKQEYPLFEDAIQKILEYGVTIEQEIFLGDLS